jgi:hypothetical protein
MVVLDKHLHFLAGAAIAATVTLYTTPVLGLAAATALGAIVVVPDLLL